MKCIILCVSIITLWSLVMAENTKGIVENSQQLTSAATSFTPFQQNRHQEKRYVTNYNDYTGGAGLGYSNYGSGYNTVGNSAGSGYYNNPYYTKNLDGYGGYAGYAGYGGYAGNAGYGGYNGYPGYNGYSGNNNYPYNSYYGTRLGAYPFNRAGYGTQNYPSSYFSNTYGNSIIGGGLGALGTPGFVPPVGVNTGYHYSPGITGSVY